MAPDARGPDSGRMKQVRHLQPTKKGTGHLYTINIQHVVIVVEKCIWRRVSFQCDVDEFYSYNVRTI